MDKFEEIGLDAQILEAISYMGFEKLTPIQSQTIPHILEGKDIIACAQTGTGKTAAFMLPILHKILQNQKKGTTALVLVPTRELAVQIDQQVQGFAYFLPVSSLAVYGGGSGAEWDTQKKALNESDIIIATPGKLLSHINVGNVKFEHVEYLILDEADRMMDMGFYDDISKIIKALPIKRQTLMFSATMPTKIRELARKSMKQPLEVNIAISKPSEKVLQVAYLVNEDHKVQLINHLIKDKPAYESIIIFVSTKKAVSQVTKGLMNFGHKPEGLSSDLEQNQREDVLKLFRSRQVRIIVATDVLSRGIDIKDIHLVINYNVPSDGEDYVHRIGRTARADTEGVAITLINKDEMYKFVAIEQLIGKEIQKLNVPSEIGESPVWSTAKQKTFRGNHSFTNSPKNKKFFKPKNKFTKK